ncbi:hypothetical protein [Enterovibrio coralii]|nr:hypothetical protein [Enterovibrio coralii]
MFTLIVIVTAMLPFKALSEIPDHFQRASLVAAVSEFCYEEGFYHSKHKITDMLYGYGKIGERKSKSVYEYVVPHNANYAEYKTNRELTQRFCRNAASVAGYYSYTNTKGQYRDNVNSIEKADTCKIARAKKKPY